MDRNVRSPVGLVLTHTTSLHPNEEESDKPFWIKVCGVARLMLATANNLLRAHPDSVQLNQLSPVPPLLLQMPNSVDRVTGQ